MTAHIVGFLVMFGVVLVLMGLGIRGSKRKEHIVLPQAEIGMYVEALLHPQPDVPSMIKFENTVVGEILAIHPNGTMTVREWEHGDEHRCLSTGFVPCPSHEAAIMRRLRTEQDSHDMGPCPTSTVN